MAVGNPRVTPGPSLQRELRSLWQRLEALERAGGRSSLPVPTATPAAAPSVLSGIQAPRRSAPSANTLTELYVVPSGRTARVSITAANSSATEDTIYLGVAVSGAGEVASDWIFARGVLLLKDFPFEADLGGYGFPVPAGYAVRAKSVNGTTTFGVGVEEFDQ